MYHWLARAEAWDEECKRRLLDQHNDQIKSMGDRHIQIAVGMQHAGTRELHAWAAKVNKADADAAKQVQGTGKKPQRDPVLTINELIKFITHGINLERLTRGEPSEIARQDATDSLDLSALSVEDLRALKRIHAKAKK